SPSRTTATARAAADQTPALSITTTSCPRGDIRHECRRPPPRTVLARSPAAAVSGAQGRDRGGAVGHAQPGAGIPTRAGSVAAVVALRDVAQRVRRGVQAAVRRARRPRVPLVDQRGEAGP